MVDWKAVVWVGWLVAAMAVKSVVHWADQWDDNWAVLMVE